MGRALSVPPWAHIALSRSYGQSGRRFRGLSWGFTAAAGWCSGYLLQGERDRGADEVEGLPLGAGGFGEHRDGDLGAGVADLVAGQGGQVLDQAAEPVVALAGRIVLAGGFGL